MISIKNGAIKRVDWHQNNHQKHWFFKKNATTLSFVYIKRHTVAHLKDFFMIKNFILFKKTFWNTFHCIKLEELIKKCIFTGRQKSHFSIKVTVLYWTRFIKNTYSILKCGFFWYNKTQIKLFQLKNHMLIDKNCQQ